VSYEITNIKPEVINKLRMDFWTDEQGEKFELLGKAPTDNLVKVL
jgi:hypothetical protein